MISHLSAPYFQDAIQLSTQVLAGKDAKDLLILVHGDTSFIEDYKSLLTSIIKAVGYNYETDIYLSYSLTPLYDLMTFCRARKIRKIIDFGKSPSKIGLKVKKIPYSVLSLGEVQFLYSDTLDLIQDDETLKGKLWTAMKEMFHV